MRFGDFAPFGLFRFSNEPSPAERIYQTYLDGSPASAATDPHECATFFAFAKGQALSGRTLERAANQARPRKAAELIHLLEADFAYPVPDGLPARRRRLGAAMRLARGNQPGNVIGTLRELLGEDFLGLAIVSADDAEVHPSDPADPMTGAINCQDVRIAPKEARLVDDVAPPYDADGHPLPVTVGYEPLGPWHPEDVLTPGDVLIVEGENSGLAERVTVVAVEGSAGNHSLTATFSKAHSAGATVTTADWPCQWSTKRIVFVVVKSAASVDPDKRAIVDSHMSRLVRAASQWFIVQPTSPGADTIGPFVLGVTPMGTAPITQIPFTVV